MARTRTLLVTGASGHLGRRVVELLVGAGADRLLLVSTDAVDFPGRRIEQHRAAIAAAKAAGVEHIIYTSFADPDPRFRGPREARGGDDCARGPDGTGPDQRLRLPFLPERSAPGGSSCPLRKAVEYRCNRSLTAS